MQVLNVVENGIEYEVRFDEDSTKEWYLNGKLHREDAPAIEYANGYKAWYQNGKRHRLDGPAIEYSDGTLCFFYHGVAITDEIEELGYQNADPEFLRVMVTLIAAGKG